FSTTLALSRRTTTFKAAAARQTIRIVEVPVKATIAAILQRTRPQARRRAWPIRLGVTSLVIFVMDAVERPDPQTCCVLVESRGHSQRMCRARVIGVAG